MSEPSVLVVDDDKNVRETIRDVLSLGGIAVVAAGPDEDLPRLVREHGVRVVVTDLNMPQIDGLDLLLRVKALAGELGLEIPVFVVTGAGGEGRVEEALSMGASGFFPKPFDLEDFTARIRSELTRVSS